MADHGARKPARAAGDPDRRANEKILDVKILDVLHRVSFSPSTRPPPPLPARPAAGWMALWIEGRVGVSIAGSLVLPVHAGCIVETVDKSDDSADALDCDFDPAIPFVCGRPGPDQCKRNNHRNNVEQ